MSAEALAREIREDMRELFEKIDKIETRLFRGNGRKSIQEETSLNTAEIACMRNDIAKLMRHQTKRPSPSVSQEMNDTRAGASMARRSLGRTSESSTSNATKIRNGVAAALVAAVGSGGIVSYLIDKLIPEKPAPQSQSQPVPRPPLPQPPPSDRQPLLPAKQTQQQEDLRLGGRR